MSLWLSIQPFECSDLAALDVMISLRAVFHSAFSSGDVMPADNTVVRVPREAEKNASLKYAYIGTYINFNTVQSFSLQTHMQLYI